MAVALAVATGWVAVPPAAAQAAPPPVVTVTATSATATQATDCRGLHRTTHRGEVTFTVHRTGATTADLAVDVERSGDLAAGLPDPVTIPAGQDEVTLTVDPATGYQGVLTAVAGSAYDVGGPASAEARVHLVIADLGCNLGYPDRFEETIAVGDRPTDLDDPVAEGDRTMVLEGSPPPGLELRADGTWAGAATTVGTTRFIAYGCGADGWCPYELDLAIHVVPRLVGDPGPDPATPPPPPPAAALPGTATFTG